MAAAGTGAISAVAAQDLAVIAEEIPAFPADGFPAGSVRLNFNEYPLGLSPYSHRAPFLMADCGRPADPIVRSLRERRVFIQPGSNWGMPTFIRVSVGTASDNRAFLEALHEVVA